MTGVFSFCSKCFCKRLKELEIKEKWPVEPFHFSVFIIVFFFWLLKAYLRQTKPEEKHFSTVQLVHFGGKSYNGFGFNVQCFRLWNNAKGSLTLNVTYVILHSLPQLELLQRRLYRTYVVNRHSLTFPLPQPYCKNYMDRSNIEEPYEELVSFAWRIFWLIGRPLTSDHVQ